MGGQFDHAQAAADAVREVLLTCADDGQWRAELLMERRFREFEGAVRYDCAERVLGQRPMVPPHPAAQLVARADPVPVRPAAPVPTVLVPPPLPMADDVFHD